jgi:hypothetical protein
LYLIFVPTRLNHVLLRQALHLVIFHDTLVCCGASTFKRGADVGHGGYLRK